MRDRWIKTTLGDLADITTGSRAKGGAISSGVPSIGGEQISEDRTIRFDKMKYVSLEHFEGMRSGKLEFGDSLLVKDGATTGKVGFWRYKIAAAVNEHVFVLRAKRKIVEPYFVNLLISHDSFQAEIESRTRGIIGGITRDIENIEFTIPQLPEQKRIVDLIASVDEALVSTEKYLIKCQSLYFSISNNLFNNLTIPLTKLGDYCESKDIQIGPFGSQLHASDYQDDGVPVVMPKDIVGGKISTAKIARISEQKASELSKHRLFVGDTLFARRGDLTKRAIVSESEDGWICGTGTVRVRSQQLNPQILFNSVNTDEVNAWLNSHAVGATMPNINTSLVGNIPVRVPVGVEKQVLALESLDLLVVTTQKLIEKLKLTRSSLLSDLLNGNHEIPASYDKVMDVA
jgi:type I restriction enzyme S subunit